MNAIPDRELVLAVDLGTGGPKVALVSLAGVIEWSGFRSTVTTRGPNGIATQDADDWWRSIVELTRTALSEKAIEPERIIAVAVTGQWSSTVPVDAEGLPVAPCRLWMDTSAAGHSADLIGGKVMGYHPTRMPVWVRRTAGAPSPSGGDPISHMLGFTRDDSVVAQRARWFLEPIDALTMRMTGIASASAASMSGAWLVDVRGPRATYDPALIGWTGIDPARLPELGPALRTVGPLRPEVATELGLPRSCVVVGAVPDIHSAWVGSGALGPGQSHLAISTTSWISAEVDRKKTDVFHSIATIPGLRPGSYLMANNHEAAGASLAWLAATFPGLDYGAWCSLAATSPVGANGARFAPWLAGMRSPVDDRAARASWHGMSLTTSRADLARAVLEGVALQAAWLLGPVERFVGRELDALRILGGGAQSDLWCQIHADALGRTIERVRDPMHAQLRGAALLAGIALGALSFDDVSQRVPVDGAFTARQPEARAYAGMRDGLRSWHRTSARVR